MELEEELRLVERLHNKIITAIRYQDQNVFDEMYKLLENELWRVNSTGEHAAYGSYPWNLNETLTSEAKMYRDIRYSKRTSKRDKASHYKDFLSDFEQDVSNHLIWLKHKANARAQE